ncbi:hypothetical protein OHO83_09515 [Streptomyces sp. NBC_00569]|uniref:hypothetical protein n=1 Tax=Streptomyces sp. NBC_00569 TaxID=2975780 RepID=UPI002E81903D|nr:hypothetical protein [Streptomyces sp. NBC_00569]WUB99767.1 hypothetical protein OHO83_09515 [Streptomyces sp. NBC_00569]
MRGSAIRVTVELWRSHRLSCTGRTGRAAGGWSYGQILGLAYSDGDVIESLHRAGLTDAEELLDNP